LKLWLAGVDHAITIAFVLEAVFKVRRDTWRGYIGDGWNVFDFILVVLALPSLASLFLDSGMEAYGIFLVLRALRVVKLLRTVRFFPNVDELVSGVVRAAKASFVVLIAFVITLLIAALFSQRLFADVSPEHFGDPAKALYSTFKIFTVEGWFDIPDEITAQMPALARFFSRGWFIIILMGGGIFGLSLVNSVFVDAMVADNNDALEAKVDALTAEIRSLREQLEKRG
jgi:voltage-gated sodium channel